MKFSPPATDGSICVTFVNFDDPDDILGYISYNDYEKQFTFEVTDDYSLTVQHLTEILAKLNELNKTNDPN